MANDMQFHLRLSFVVFISINCSFLFAQNRLELNKDWFCKNSEEVKISGEQLTIHGSFKGKDWMPATVPGTVLTNLLKNEKVPDPFYGMNNEAIPDISETGRAHYTYWFYNEFEIEAPKETEQFWLHFRGVNYSAETYLNGKKVNPQTHHGMFLRQSYNITALIKGGTNRLAVLVLPPDPAGVPGGQGGDGTIAKNITHQYVAGWDWIQPVRDRNTGIWDKVFLERTGPVDLKNPHVISKVPGKRFPGKEQAPAIIKTSVELKNATKNLVEGILLCSLEGKEVQKKVKLSPFETQKVILEDFTLENPKLWWPNGYGGQPLYDLSFQFQTGGQISDEENVRIGIREITPEWNPFTRSTQIRVNGQKIFIKGGNWIISDAMLRFSEERYDAEIRMHRDMNLNNIRIWGGAITERPEFYKACDKYGILVMQDFWISGDCNGRWLDPRKKEDQWTRRQYPDDHQLFLQSAGDQIKMIRNHPSLAFWCGGNEMAPPEDILIPLKDSLKILDGTRWFIEHSNSDSMSYNFIGGNGDGPYGIQPLESFFEHRTFPFNSEVGSVGVPDYASLKRFIPDEAMIAPGKYEPKEIEDEQRRRWLSIHPVWRYHKFSSYRDFITNYGEVKSVENYTLKAQLANYNQYRALMEGFTSHMWEWYTGFMIWKTQNPWTAMRGQMYDYYLDQNAGLYGLHHGSKALHIFYDPVKSQVLVANNTFEIQRDLMFQAITYSMSGEKQVIYQELPPSINETSVKRYHSLERRLKPISEKEGCFLLLRMTRQNGDVLDENFYWLPDKDGKHSGLQKMAQVKLDIKAQLAANRKIKVTLKNPSEDNPVAFFNRIALINASTGERVLPSFFSDNYVSVLPGEEKVVWIESEGMRNAFPVKVRVYGWNVGGVDVDIE